MQSIALQTTTRNGFTISYIDEKEFESLWEDIFVRKEYLFSCKAEAPFIIDCGAHIGLSVLYFKQCYPRAQIIAFEPNPQTFQILERNIKQNSIHGVELINAAVGDRNGETVFYIRQDSVRTWGDTVLKEAIIGNERQWRTINAQIVCLSSYITQLVDYLKVDIEGMEERVLREIEAKLPLVREIRMEFHHNSTNEANNLDRILLLLARYNFKYAFVRGGDVVSFRKIKQSIKDTNLYFFTIFLHPKRSRIFWQAWLMPKFIRIQNKIMKTNR